FELVELIIVSSYCNPIQMLVAMPFHNLEFCDSNDSSLGIYIMNRLLVNSETVELLTFTPPMGDSPEGMLVLEAPPRRYSKSLLMKCANGITRRPQLSDINGRGCSRLCGYR
nr:hypothetical protein [Tanacetum cinerariifolium]